MQRKTIAFLCFQNLKQFIDPIAEVLKEDFNVVKCYSNDPVRLFNAIDQADIIWIEWGNELAIEICQNSKAFNFEGKNVICRVHSYEALSGMIPKINWNVPTDVIFVANHVRDLCLSHIQQINKNIRIHVIPNGVDTSKFTLASDKINKEINMSFVGFINSKKGPMLMLQAFKDLVDDPRHGNDYLMHIAGDFQDARYLYYMEYMTEEMNLGGRSKYHKWVEDINGFYQNMDYVVVSSPWESQHMACMEAMACGVFPLIHNFIGCKEIYNPDWIWTTIKDFTNLTLDRDSHHTPQELRQWVINNYEFTDKLNELKEVILLDPPKVSSKPISKQSNTGGVAVDDQPNPGVSVPTPKKVVSPSKQIQKQKEKTKRRNKRKKSKKKGRGRK